ncbi:MAG: hypothetical protein DELT_01856 [Desulfovibrio sp.]
MKKMLRIAVIGGVSLILLLCAAAVVALVVIDPNDYKPKIEAAALEATGKQLHLEGDLSLSVFPTISIQAGPATIEDDPSFGGSPFLKVEKVSASVALFPLFSGKVEIGTVEVSGARLKLAVNKDGKNNWSVPEKPAASAKPAKSSNPAESSGSSQGSSSGSPLAAIALDTLSITDAVIVYADIPAKTEMSVTVKKLELNTVKIGEKSTLSLEASVAGIFAAPTPITLSASFTLPATLAEGSTVTAEGKFAETPFSFNGFAALPKGAALKGEATMGALNLDTLLASPGKNAQPQSQAQAQANASSKQATKTAAANDTALAGTLRDLFLDVHLKVQSVTMQNIPLKNIQATIKADNGLVTAKPVSLDVFGPMTAEANLDARAASIKSRVSGTWKNVTVGPLVKAVTGKTPLTGTLDANWNVNATGLAWPAISKSLGGKVTVKMADGNIPAFQLIPKGLPGLPATTMDLTGVTCSSTWNITNGVAANNDMAVKASALTATGQGKISLPAERIDYTMDVNIPTIKELPDLKVLPLVISGPLTSPSYAIDQPAVLKQTVKSVLDPSTKVGKEVEKGLGKALKGILKK